MGNSLAGSSQPIWRFRCQASPESDPPTPAQAANLPATHPPRRFGRSNKERQPPVCGARCHALQDPLGMTHPLGRLPTQSDAAARKCQVTRASGVAGTVRQGPQGLARRSLIVVLCRRSRRGWPSRPLRPLRSALATVAGNPLTEWRSPAITRPCFRSNDAAEPPSQPGLLLQGRPGHGLAAGGRDRNGRPSPADKSHATHRALSVSTRRNRWLAGLARRLMRRRDG